MRYHALTGLLGTPVRSPLVRESSGPLAAPWHRRVLLVDDDVGVLETWALLLADAGVQVEVAPTAQACVRIAAARAFDLMVIDLRLGADNGLDVIRQLRAHGQTVPFILATAHASVAVRAEAMRLGARTVLEKPLVGDDLVAPVLRELSAAERENDGGVPAPGALAQRWARFVMRATDSDADPRTLAEWARAAGVSRSALIEVSARLGISPRDGRDLARFLRLVRRDFEPWDPGTALNVSDRRTLRSLLVRAGLAATPRGSRPSPQQFLAGQRFVPQTNAGLAALRQLLG